MRLNGYRFGKTRWRITLSLEKEKREFQESWQNIFGVVCKRKGPRVVLGEITAHWLRRQEASISAYCNNSLNKARCATLEGTACPVTALQIDLSPRWDRRKSGPGSCLGTRPGIREVVLQTHRWPPCSCQSPSVPRGRYHAPANPREGLTFHAVGKRRKPWRRD